MMKTPKLLTATLAVLIAGAAPAVRAQVSAPETLRTPDVIYVPTPQPVVDAMLRLAKVQKGEMVYDLGCGDGRAVVTAARDFGARGIGVDIDPKRVEESNANVAKAGVADRVQIKQADLFQMKFADADVLFLYLLPALNVRLRPRILDELRPGTRVVSNSFAMAEWEADEQLEVDDKTIYFWMVPAKVAGTWKVTLSNNEEATLTLTQEFQKVSGSVKTKDKTYTVNEGRLRGAELTFNLGEGTAAGRVTGELVGDQLKGTVQRDGNSQPQTWTAQMVR
jgi:ubiquinone/menaquinone biosynthesis C-methylase UbiE